MIQLSLVFLSFVFWAGGAFAAEHEWSVGGAYTEGDYGRSRTTRITQSPVSYAWRNDHWRSKITAVWLSIDGGGQDASLYSIKKAEGWSDATGLVEYRFSPSSRWVVAVSAQVKIPLSSYESGLSTGEKDHGAQINGYYVVTTKTTWFARWNLWWRHDPAIVDLRDREQYLLGIYHRTNERWALGATIDYVEKATTNSQPQKNLALFTVAQLTSQWSILPYAIAGFTSASPRWGAGVEFRYKLNN